MNFFVDIRYFSDSITQLGWQQLRLDPERLKLKSPDSQEDQSFARGGGRNAKPQYETEALKNRRKPKLRKRQRPTEAQRNWEIPKLARAEGDQGFWEQRKSKTRKSRGRPKFKGAEDVNVLRNGHGYDFARNPNMCWGSGEDNGGHSGSLFFRQYELCFPDSTQNAFQWL